MSAFHYRALDLQGREIQGVLEADSNRSARALLRERGLFPLDVGAVSAHREGGTRRRIAEGALALLTRQWATLLASGLTVEQSLTALIDQAENQDVGRLLAGVRAEVMSGMALSAALEAFATQFPPIYRASVAAGERSGRLADVLEQLAGYLERRGSLRQKTLQALLYPAIVAAVALLVVIGLMTYVVPQVVTVFQQGSQSLPPLTRGLIAVSDVLRNWGWLLPPMLLGMLLAARAGLRQPALRRRWHARLLALPLLGRHLRNLEAARLASTLAILCGSGVALLQALDAGRKVLSLIPLQEAVAGATEQVREGQSLARALGAARQFPPLLLHMIANGEATGRLGEMLDRAARLQQQDVENRITALTSLLEPALLLLMGGLVLLIVLAVMQPIIELNTLMN